MSGEIMDALRLGLGSLVHLIHIGAAYGNSPRYWALVNIGVALGARVAWIFIAPWGYTKGNDRLSPAHVKIL